jgi:hypothetical protein
MIGQSTLQALFLCAMSPHDHLRTWFTEERRKLIRSSELDRQAGRPVGTFSRFLAGSPTVPLTYSPGLTSYYPALALLGYQPPTPPPSARAAGPQMGQHSPDLVNDTTAQWNEANQ